MVGQAYPAIHWTQAARPPSLQQTTRANITETCHGSVFQYFSINVIIWDRSHLVLTLEVSGAVSRLWQIKTRNNGGKWTYVVCSILHMHACRHMIPWFKWIKVQHTSQPGTSPILSANSTYTPPTFYSYSAHTLLILRPHSTYTPPILWLIPPMPGLTPPTSLIQQSTEPTLIPHWLSLGIYKAGKALLLPLLSY